MNIAPIMATRNRNKMTSFLALLTFFFLFSLAFFLRVEAHKKEEYLQNIFAETDQTHSHDNSEDDNAQNSGISKNFYSFTVQDISGRIIDLGEYEGKVTLVVNVASECGYTDGHYRALVQLQQTLGHSKFTILAFPCNQFGKQEPGDNWQIQSFAEKIYKVNFPMFAKIDVIGANAPKCWKFLTETTGMEPTWNFWKYLVNENGVVLNAWGPQTSLTDVYKHIREALDKPRVNQHLHSDL